MFAVMFLIFKANFLFSVLLWVFFSFVCNSILHGISHVHCSGLLQLFTIFISVWTTIFFHLHITERNTSDGDCEVVTGLRQLWLIGTHFMHTDLLERKLFDLYNYNIWVHFISILRLLSLTLAHNNYYKKPFFLIICELFTKKVNVLLYKTFLLILFDLTLWNIFEL